MLETVNPELSIDKEEYVEKLIPLQVALHTLGYQVYVQQRPVVIVYEGWDAAGKGGNIKRVTEKLDPRGYTVHAISAPSGEDKTHHYLWRFWRRLPEKGQIAIFDRSWYGRVMVERIEGFCTEPEWKRAYREINHFERQLVDFGTIMFKFWIHISKEEQLARFEQRKDVAYKSWKLTDEDWRNRGKWEDYFEAVNDMLIKTSTLTAPWTVIEGNCKWFARVKVLQTLVDGLSESLQYDPFQEGGATQKTLKKKKKKKEKKEKAEQKSKLDTADHHLVHNGPMIEGFEFEKITIDGSEFHHDVIIKPDGVVAPWHRKNDHVLEIEELAELMAEKPKTVIIGTGTVGNLLLADGLEEFLEDKKVSLEAHKTQKAVQVYRELQNQEATLGLFHIGD